MRALKALILLATLSVLAAPAFARDVYVKPHVKKDGTVVQGHYRTSPNSTRLDNYSTRGNVNPHTGERGTKPIEPDPYRNYGDRR